MKFNVLGTSLWTGIQQVMNLTQTRQPPANEMAIETIGHNIIVYRQNHQCKAQFVLQGHVEKEGKIIIRDITPLQFHENSIIFHHKKNGTRVLVSDDEFKTRLVISKTDPDNFEMIEVNGKFHPLPKMAKKTLWIYDKLEMPIHISKNVVMAADGGALFSWFKGNSTISPRPCTMLASTFALISDDVMLQVADDALWIKTTNLTAKMSYQFSPWKGDTLLDRFGEPVNWCRINRNDLYLAMKYAHALSKTQIFVGGLIYLKLENNKVIVTTAEEGAGQGQKSIEVIESQGSFNLKMIPNQIGRALLAADSDEVIIEQGGNGILIKAEQIISGIAQITVT